VEDLDPCESLAAAATFLLHPPLKILPFSSSHCLHTSMCVHVCLFSISLFLHNDKQASILARVQPGDEDHSFQFADSLSCNHQRNASSTTDDRQPQTISSCRWPSSTTDDRQPQTISSCGVLEFFCKLKSIAQTFLPCNPAKRFNLPNINFCFFSWFSAKTNSFVGCCFLQSFLKLSA